ncbi:hypothetical protein QCD60_20855 [Pokkaliibacter sp. MBI-7]|uniref:hypothetical protein n=1 Tax=Pokkaliibacter sp. MBI-7 TaxID=3040600 RepID=UPI00244C6775|nr:hypothetical protein [Pokkaliibacter sp. MBI-7]MDH2434988.1 hypothetical protein [Pokkaliibacter sp. MBI-7]
MRKSTVFWCTLLLIAAGIVAAILYNAKSLGEQRGKANIERLQMVWPTLFQMPEKDRTLLAVLAIDCRMDLIDPSKQGVVDCLEHSLKKSNPLLPKDVSVEQARSRFAEIVSESSH